MNFWMTAGLIVAVMGTWVAHWSLRSKREAKRRYEALTKLNRERIDSPGWTKQPWQHDTCKDKPQS